MEAGLAEEATGEVVLDLGEEVLEAAVDSGAAGAASEEDGEHHLYYIYCLVRRWGNKPWF